MPVPLKISAPILLEPISPSFFQQFRRNPVLFLAHWLYSHRELTIPASSAAPRHDGLGCEPPSITVVCISDTHNTTTAAVPAGDILLHAGDLTNKGSFAEIQAQLNWLNTLPHPYKICIGGNHDLLLDKDFVSSFPERILPREGEQCRDLNWGNITYLKDSSITFTVNTRIISVFGSPMTPQFGNWAFQYPPVRDVWKDAIPVGTDIVLTHGAPKGHLDMEGKGCGWLLRELWRMKPKLVVFGHLHAGRGIEDVSWDTAQRVFDGVQLGDCGLISVLGMAVVIGTRRFWAWLSGRPTIGETIFVNAAVVGGLGNSKHFPAIVVEI